MAAPRCWWAFRGRRTGDCYNAYALLERGRIEAVRFKVDLPNYGVFDEKRVFEPGRAPGPIAFRGVRIGLPICEDIWTPEIVETLVETGAEMLLVPNGSPYWRGKHDERIAIAVARVAESGLPLVYLNQIGGQDELVFDGGSFALNGDCSLAAQLPAFQSQVTSIAFARRNGAWVCEDAPKALVPEGDEADYLGLHGGPARLRRQEPLSRRRDGPVGRRRFSAVRGARRRCAGARARALRDAALSLHLE